MENKEDASYCMISDLKRFNQHVEYQHFKMDSVRTLVRLLTPSCYMASVDLKDAYFSVPIAEPRRKYLQFGWNNALLGCTCFHDGSSTKLMKPVFATLQ